MKITILGCGSSGGVPLVTGNWGECNPFTLKNRRQRASLLLEVKGKRILVDASPDLREQFLKQGIQEIDAIIITHAHADHIFGLPDLRQFYLETKKTIPVYSDEKTIHSLKNIFAYAFKGNSTAYPPFLTGHVISDNLLTLDDIVITVFEQCHGAGKSLGLRVENFAYSTDMSHLPLAALNQLKNLELWVVDALRREPHPTHCHLEKTLNYIAQLTPKRSVLTHLSHEVDYDNLLKELPSTVFPAYDGMVITL